MDKGLENPNIPESDNRHPRHSFFIENDAHDDSIELRALERTADCEVEKDVTGIRPQHEPLGEPTTYLYTGKRRTRRQRHPDSPLPTVQQHMLARRYLYVSHCLAQFSEIAWQFSLTLFLIASTNYQSLILVSSYGFTVSLAVTLGSSKVGTYIDKSQDTGNRLSVARWLLLGENTCVILATIFCYILLVTLPSQSQYSTNSSVENQSVPRGIFHGVPKDFLSILCLLMIHVAGSMAQILDCGFLVAMERDWVVVLCQSYGRATVCQKPPIAKQGDSRTVDTTNEDLSNNVTSKAAFRQWLSETNVTMKQIDLTCKVVAPAIIGFFVPLTSSSGLSIDTESDQQVDSHEESTPNANLEWACLMVGALNAFALLVEYYCTAFVYQTIPALAKTHHSILMETMKADDTNHTTKVPMSEEEEDGADLSVSSSDMARLLDDSRHSKASYSTMELDSGSLKLCIGSELVLYFQQSIAWGGFALALLYSNALTFGNGIMTGYLLYRGVDVATVGVLRGTASVIGLLGTCVYHLAVKRLSLESTGMVSICYQTMCLFVGLVSLFVGNKNTSLIMLVSGVCLSRIGLWVFDITVTQMQQEEIPDGIRGRVGGVQQALNSVFNLLSFVSGFLYPHPEQFFVFVCAGFLGVVAATVCFSLGVFMPRLRK